MDKLKLYIPIDNNKIINSSIDNFVLNDLIDLMNNDIFITHLNNNLNFVKNISKNNLYNIFDNDIKNYKQIINKIGNNVNFIKLKKKILELTNNNYNNLETIAILLSLYATDNKLIQIGGSLHTLADIANSISTTSKMITDKRRIIVTGIATLDGEKVVIKMMLKNKNSKPYEIEAKIYENLSTKCEACYSKYVIEIKESSTIIYDRTTKTLKSSTTKTLLKNNSALLKNIKLYIESIGKHLLKQYTFFYMIIRDASGLEPPLKIYKELIRINKITAYKNILDILGKLNYHCGFYHGDLKNDNVFSNPDGTEIKFFDFDFGGIINQVPNNKLYQSRFNEKKRKFIKKYNYAKFKDVLNFSGFDNKEKFVKIIKQFKKKLWDYTTKINLTPSQIIEAKNMLFFYDVIRWYNVQTMNNRKTFQPDVKDFEITNQQIKFKLGDLIDLINKLFNDKPYKLKIIAMPGLKERISLCYGFKTKHNLRMNLYVFGGWLVAVLYHIMINNNDITIV